MVAICSVRMAVPVLLPSMAVKYKCVVEEGGWQAMWHVLWR